MKPHVKNYHKQNGIYPSDFIECEFRSNKCLNTAVDIHHINFGRYNRSDEPENLIALCRYCHNLAHGKVKNKPQTPKEDLLLIAARRCKK